MIIFRERCGLQYMLSCKTSDRQDFYFSFISFLTGMSGDVSTAQNLEKQAVIGCSDNRDTALVIQRDWVKKQKLARPVEADQQRMASCLLAGLAFTSLSHNLSLSLKHSSFGPKKVFPLWIWSFGNLIMRQKGWEIDLPPLGAYKPLQQQESMRRSYNIQRNQNCNYNLLSAQPWCLIAL